MTIRVFGLTGGIGSGKSSVAARLRQRGLPVVDADELAREAVQPGSAALADIVARFGAEVLADDGQLDRKKLGARVFSDDQARAALNAIVHPRVRELSQRRFAELDRRGEPLACYEVPLLFEVGLADILRPVVVVFADESSLIARIRARDGATAEQALARIRAQLPLAEKRRRADYVIDNDADLHTLRARTDDLLDQICRELGVDPARYPR